MKVANFTLSDNTLTNGADRLLRDEGGGDGGLFKGIFVRYFTALILHPDLPDPYRKRYIAYLKNNLETLWYSGTRKPWWYCLVFGYWKNKPGSETEVIQLSGAIFDESRGFVEEE